MEFKSLGREARLEVKAGPSSKPMVFSGYASHFETPDLVGDIIMPDAYHKTLSEREYPIVMLRGHLPAAVIGRWTAARVDAKGLHVTGELTPHHSVADDTGAMLRHAGGALSIGFNIPAGGAKARKGGGRELLEIDLIEISVVTFPADSAARVDAVRDAGLNAARAALDAAEAAAGAYLLAAELGAPWTEQAQAHFAKSLRAVGAALRG